MKFLSKSQIDEIERNTPKSITELRKIIFFTGLISGALCWIILILFRNDVILNFHLSATFFHELCIWGPTAFGGTFGWTIGFILKKYVARYHGLEISIKERCTKCGFRNRPGAKFCSNCGNHFLKPTEYEL